ncbi:rhomboid family intramembrane serine protease [Stakelama sediminis]|uniref:Membrane associated rhomboid family serine protease n=2 Tax=Stakelama sediminis TaxID=463200 RepID=A0A840YZ88_9SPHN|nr:rhomboid family intramembrane serine protease [Stakelama sediminis]MBB5718963.1 membrane associated rhomboid family serine protease [Stakelama sediminis]
MHARDVPATVGIAAVTTLVSLAILGLGYLNPAAAWAGFIPARYAGVSVIAAHYSLAPFWLTPLTATFVHAGMFHLIFNMVMLVYTGSQTERAIGPGPLVLLYVLGAYGAALAQWLIGPLVQSPMIGASGALSACVGAYALLFGTTRAKAIGPIPARAVQVIWLGVAWAGINLLVGLVSRQSGMPIAGAAHVGGFLVGLALAKPLLAWHWRNA